MSAIEFVTTVVDGAIVIPTSHRDRFQGEVRVRVEAKDHHNDNWSIKNARRWSLLAKRDAPGLTPEEACELDELDDAMNRELAALGAYPTDPIGRLYAELSKDETVEAQSKG